MPLREQYLLNFLWLYSPITAVGLEWGRGVSKHELTMPFEPEFWTFLLICSPITYTSHTHNKTEIPPTPFPMKLLFSVCPNLVNITSPIHLLKSESSFILFFLTFHMYLLPVWLLTPPLAGPQSPQLTKMHIRFSDSTAWKSSVSSRIKYKSLSTAW